MDIPFSRLITGVFLLLIGVFVYRSLHPATTFAADGIDSTWDAAVQESHDSGKPTIVLFTAGWCPACQMLHRELSTGAVEAELAHYYFHTVSLTQPTPQNQEHARQFGARYIPLMIRYDTNQKETGRTNFLPTEQLVEWLKEGE
ncbi:MAG TPA: thioredoxin fold domain-containing protein [Tepidisphaeraceae bacterium]|jgi:thiol:disulfide interchange protein|nr:thioredoxin fold domain-containing protein [Tepidisphaeraceae bacterium]